MSFTSETGICNWEEEILIYKQVTLPVKQCSETDLCYTLEFWPRTGIKANWILSKVEADQISAVYHIISYIGTLL